MLTVAPGGSDEIASFPGCGGICGKSVAGHSSAAIGNSFQNVVNFTSIAPNSDR
jgi:hypothetical protein